MTNGAPCPNYKISFTKVKKKGHILIVHVTLIKNVYYNMPLSRLLFFIIKTCFFPVSLTTRHKAWQIPSALIFASHKPLYGSYWLTWIILQFSHLQRPLPIPAKLHLHESENKKYVLIPHAILIKKVYYNMPLSCLLFFIIRPERRTRSVPRGTNYYRFWRPKTQEFT